VGSANLRISLVYGDSAAARKVRPDNRRKDRP
jgi:hypothetical protein